MKPFTPAFRAWLEQERSWGSQAIREISRQREAADGRLRGLERFTVRMSLVELTGLIAAWANGLQAGLIKVGAGDGARPFAVSPPFAEEVTEADYDHLKDYLAVRVEILTELLADAPPAPRTPA